MPTHDDNEHILTSLAKLDEYCDRLAIEIARAARITFERELIDALMATGHVELAAELREIFNADA